MTRAKASEVETVIAEAHGALGAITLAEVGAKKWTRLHHTIRALVAIVRELHARDDLQKGEVINARINRRGCKKIKVQP